jgi:hypothetical protein
VTNSHTAQMGWFTLEALVENCSFATGHKQLLPSENNVLLQKQVVLDELFRMPYKNNLFLQKSSCFGQVI